MLRFGLLGAGRIGQIHGRNIAASEGAELAAIADADAGAARKLADATGAEVRSVEAILSAGDIGAILIGTPTDTHAGLIEAAARAGKAVFCEKPVDLDAARVRACLKVVADTGARLMVGFNRRFDPNFVEARRRSST